MKDLKDNKWVLAALTLVNGIVLWNYIAKGQTLHGLGYVMFFYVAILAIHFFTSKIPPRGEFEVKEPRKELKVTVLFAALGALFIVGNLYLRSTGEQVGFLVRLPLLIGMALFTFPVGLALYLWRKKYKLPQFGLAFRPVSFLFLGVLIWALTGLFAFFFYPSGIIWSEGYEELGGVAGMIWSGLIMAGLAEEFSRFVMQSRLQRVIHSSGFSILIATALWAFMHFPINYFKGSPVSSIIVYCIQIIPLGFIWGYLTHRTKSIVPSTLAHGFNLWGFQNG
jgi:membrane protease YdiL (CAAX protease family)